MVAQEAFLTGLVGGSIVLQMAALTIAALGIYSCLGTFWSLPTAFLSGTAAAAGIALVNSGGFVGPYAVGALSEATGASYAGMLFLAVLILLAAFLALAVRHERSLEEVGRVISSVTAPTNPNTRTSN